MHLAQLIEPSFTSFSGMYLNRIAGSDFLNPDIQSSLSLRVGAFALQRLAAFPLILCAVADLIVWSLMSIVVLCAYQVGGKHHLINLISTLSLFPQAIPLFILGKEPQVNHIRRFGSATISIIDQIKNSHAYSSKKRQLILTQLKGFNANEVDRFKNKKCSRRGYEPLFYALRGAKVSQGKYQPWPEMAEFLIDQRVNFTFPHAESEGSAGSYLTLLLDTYSKHQDQQMESIALKLVARGAPYRTRSDLNAPDNLSDLERAVSCGFKELSEKLLAQDDILTPLLTPEQSQARNDKLLRLAAVQKQPALLKLLLAKEGANPVNPNALGRTAWACAIETHNHENIGLFLAHGVDPNLSITFQLADQNPIATHHSTALDFCIFSFINLRKGLSVEEVNLNLQESPEFLSKERLAHLQTMQMLSQGGAHFKEGFLNDENFSKLVCEIDNNEFDANTSVADLENLKKKYQANPYFVTILDLIIASPFLIENINFLLQQTPALTNQQDTFIESRAAVIDGVITSPTTPFVHSLADLISQYV